MANSTTPFFHPDGPTLYIDQEDLLQDSFHTGLHHAHALANVSYYLIGYAIEDFKISSKYETRLTLKEEAMLAFMDKLTIGTDPESEDHCSLGDLRTFYINTIYFNTTWASHHMQMKWDNIQRLFICLYNNEPCRRAKVTGNVVQLDYVTQAGYRFSVVVLCGNPPSYDNKPWPMQKYCHISFMRNGVGLPFLPNHWFEKRLEPIYHPDPKQYYDESLWLHPMDRKKIENVKAVGEHLQNIKVVPSWKEWCCQEWRRYFDTLPCKFCEYFPDSDLSQDGDIETNPGPSDDQQQVETPALTIEEIQRQTALLEKRTRELKKMFLTKKEQKKKNAAHLQREIEKEKRKRSRNRKLDNLRKIDQQDLENFNKRYAQGLMNFTNNIGTTAQVVSDNIGPSFDLMNQTLSALADTASQIKAFFNISSEIDFIDIFVDIITICKCALNGDKTLIAVNAFNLARHLKVSFADIMSLFPSTNSTTVSFGDPTPTTSEPRQYSESLLTDMLDEVAKRTDLLPVTSSFTFIIGALTLFLQGTMPTPSEMMKHFFFFF